jgi:hypothetical protein
MIQIFLVLMWFFRDIIFQLPHLSCLLPPSCFTSMWCRSRGQSYPQIEGEVKDRESGQLKQRRGEQGLGRYFGD